MDMINCVRGGELLLGAIALLVLLIAAGSLGALILCHRRPGGTEHKPSMEQSGTKGTNVAS